MSQKLTKNQKLVYDVLSHAAQPKTAYNLLDDLREEGIKAPLQIYRALDKLIEMGIVHRLDSLNAFVACIHEEHHHGDLSAFSICRECGEVKEFSSREIEDLLDQAARVNGFHVEQKTVELRGLCRNCHH